MAESSVSYMLNKFASFLENEMQFFMKEKEEIIANVKTLEHINACLRTADSLEETDDEVKVWVKQIRDAAHDMEDAVDEFKLLLAKEQEDREQIFLLRIPGIIRNLKARYRIMSDMKTISSRIKSITEGHGRLNSKFRKAQKCESSIAMDSTWHDNRGDALLLEKTDLVGIEEPKKQLMRWIIQGPQKREVISVVGMGGLGKTTLVKQVYDDPTVKKHFAIRAWLNVSPSSKTEEVLKDMLERIAEKIKKPALTRTDTVNIDWLKEMIKSMLQNKRYLIVLDDVWHVNKWDAFKYAFPNDECGSRIMLTTRMTDIASASHADFGGKTYKLEPLSAEQSWKLFCRKTFQGDSCPSHLESICKSIMSKCEGLPLPIVAISGVLAAKDVSRIDEWELVRRSLRTEINGNDRLRKINKVLSLSFNDLPYYLKSCFLHLSLFPEGHVIERRRLIRLWVAEGFIEATEGKTLEEVAYGYLAELIGRSLLQVAETTSDGRIKTCRIHHLLLQIGIKKSREQNFAAVTNEQRMEWPDKIRRISIHNRLQPLQHNRSLSHLRSLYMFGVDKQSTKAVLLFDHKLLNVLDLQAAKLKKFPIQVPDMCSLRYLSFRGTELQALPKSIGLLLNLETLDLKHTYVTELPSEIKKLQRLRHLLVYRYEIKSYEHIKYGFKTPADIGSLQSLQKLCYVDAGDDQSSILVSQLGKLSQLKRLCILNLKKEDGGALCSSITELTNLRALSIYSLEERDDLDLHDLSSPPPFLQRIYLGGRLQSLPHWITTLQSLVTAHLSCCQLKDDPLDTLQNLPNLVHLELQEVYDWEILHFNTEGFQKLKTLGLNNFNRLSSIEVEEGALPSLVNLFVHRCQTLHDIPSGIEHLRSLKLVEFFDVPDQLIKQLEQEKESLKVAHIPEVRYGWCTDDGWNVRLLVRLGEKGSSSQLANDPGNSGRPRCWK